MTTWAYQPLTPGAAALLQPAGGDDAPIQSTIVTTRRSLPAPRVVTRTPRHVIPPIPDRVPSRVTRIRSKSPRAATVTAQRRPWLSSPADNGLAATTTVIAARPLSRPPTVRIATFPQRQQLPLSHPVRSNALRARPLAKPATVQSRALRTRLDTDAFAKLVAKRIVATRVPRAVPAPTTRSLSLRTRLDTAAQQRRTPSRAVLPPRVLPKPPTVEIVLRRQRLDNEATQRTFAIRRSPIVHVPVGVHAAIATNLRPRALTSPADNGLAATQTNVAVAIQRQVPTVRLARPIWRMAVVVPERVRNRALTVTIPRPLPKPRGLWSGTTQDGDRIERLRFINSILTVPARPPVKAPRRPLTWRIHQETPGSAIAPTVVVGSAQVAGAPVVTQARPIWRSFVAAASGRVVDRSVVVDVSQGLSAPRTAIRLLRQRLDTEARERRVGPHVIIRPSVELPTPPSVTIRLLRQRLDTTAQRRPRVAVRLHTAPVAATRTTALLCRQRLDTESTERRAGPRACVRPAAPLAPRARTVSRPHRQRLDTEARERRVAERTHLLRAPRGPRGPRSLRGGLLQQLQPAPTVGLVQFDNQAFRPRTLNVAFRSRFRSRDLDGRTQTGVFTPRAESLDFDDTDNHAFTGSPP